MGQRRGLLGLAPSHGARVMAAARIGVIPIGAIENYRVGRTATAPNELRSREWVRLSFVGTPQF